MSAINATSVAASGSTNVQNDKAMLDKDGFLKLLVAQTLEDHAVIVGQDQADHALSPAKPSGTAISTCAPPSLDSTTRSPFSAATRSASMNGPSPVWRRS